MPIMKPLLTVKLGIFVQVMVAMVLTLTTRGHAQVWLPDSQTEITKVSTAVYLDFDFKPVAIIGADRVYRDFQRKGFFRIGVLPMVVLDGMTLELCDTERLSAALTNITALLKVKGSVASAIEGRNFSISFSGKKDGGIHARVVRLESGAEWRLQDGAVNRPGGAPISFRRATLTVTGHNAGTLACDTTNGTVRIPLLSLVNHNHNQPTKP